MTIPAGMLPLKTQQQVDAFTREAIASKTNAIVLDNRLIGTIGLDELGKGTGMLGFLIDERVWHQGYGTQTVNLFLNQIKKKVTTLSMPIALPTILLQLSFFKNVVLHTFRILKENIRTFLNQNNASYI